MNGLWNKLDFPHLVDMERNVVIQRIREQVNQIAVNVTAIHPLVPGLADPPTQGELFKALFELTRNVEVVKKLIEFVPMRIPGMKSKPVRWLIPGLGFALLATVLTSQAQVPPEQFTNDNMVI